MLAVKNASLWSKMALLVSWFPLHAYGELLEYKCEISEGLAKVITLELKDGSEEIADAHRIYESHHKQGWLNSLRVHVAKGNIRLLQMEREDVQEWGIMTEARRIGNLEAQVMISKALLVYEEEKLNKMLADLLRKEEALPR